MTTKAALEIKNFAEEKESLISGLGSGSFKEPQSSFSS